MRIQIDWLSFTVPAYTDTATQETYHLAIEDALQSTLSAECASLLFNHAWKERPNGRAPYNQSWDVGDTGIVVFTSNKLNHILVEMSGKGCEFMRSMLCENVVLEAIQGRISRLDIACDIETDTMPVEFVERRLSAKERHIAVVESDTGQTCYLGSMQSESYVRVYRYNKPHPRHALLRVEFVFRRKYARVIAAEIIVQGIRNVAAAAGMKRKFQHEVWNPEADFVEPLKFPRAEREASGTVFWLIKSAAPAFKRMVAEGVIDDAEGFIQAYFLT